MTLFTSAARRSTAPLVPSITMVPGSPSVKFGKSNLKEQLSFLACFVKLLIVAPCLPMTSLTLSNGTLISTRAVLAPVDCPPMPRSSRSPPSISGGTLICGLRVEGSGANGEG